MGNVFNYKELIGVEFAHDYYTTGKSNDFMVIPTPICTQLLKSAGLILKASSDGFKLYADITPSTNSFVLKRRLTKKQKFTFLVKLKNPFFLNFTDLPVQVPPGSVYYFNNLTKNIGQNNELYIIKKDDIINGLTEKYVSMEDQIQLKSMILNWTYTSTKSRVTAELRFADSGVSVVQNLENEKDTFPFQFELSSFPEECFDIYIDGIKANSTPFYNYSSLWREPVFAIIELFYSDMVPPEYQFADKNLAIQPKKYIVPFRCRKTIWRYIIQKGSNITIPDPAIVESENKWHFLPKGSLIFESKELMPLQENPIQGIYFQKDVNDTSSIILKSLPNAPIEMIRPDTKQNQIYSDIYVNI